MSLDGAGAETRPSGPLAAIADKAALWPGLALAGTAAMSAAFLAEHYGGSAFLYALLIGMALSSLRGAPALAAGLGFAGRPVLRLGVALLGANIGVAQALAIGAPALLLVALLVAATILFGVLAARIAGSRSRLGVLTGGATAICGASAALAIASVLPPSPERDRDAGFTVVCVTLLSTVAMALYPALTSLAAAEPRFAGIFLGATIHDVAQVVGAGYSASPETGDVAVLTKLFRVALLVPVVFGISLAVARMPAREEGRRRLPALPAFLLGFVALSVLCSADLLPPALREVAFAVSRALLLVAVAATGLRTEIRDFLTVGRAVMTLVLAETIFLALAAAAGLTVLSRL